MTVLELIKSALRAIGQLGPGRSPGPSETEDAVLVLNRTIEALSIERLNIPAFLRSVYPVTPSKQNYTIGPDTTADINAPRPIRIERAGTVDAAIEYPVAVQTPQTWAAIAYRQQQGRPTALYYAATAPLGTISLWPIPTVSESLALYAWQELQQVADETVDLVLQPGYTEMLTYQLAIRLAPEWGKAVRPDVMNLATQSLMRIKSLNDYPRVLTLGSELACCGGYDIHSDTCC